MDELKRRRRTLLLIGYHAISAVIIGVLYLNGTFKGGQCNLGSGLMVFMMVGLIMVGLCLTGIYLTIRNRANKYFLIINLLALAIWIVVLFTS